MPQGLFDKFMSFQKFQKNVGLKNVSKIILKQLLWLEDFVKMGCGFYNFVDTGDYIVVEFFDLLIGQVVV